MAKINLEINSIKHQIFNCGLGEKEEVVSFIKAGSEDSGVGRFDKNAQAETQLAVKRMDDCIPDDFEVDLIKIDAEGFELDVLLGAVNTIQKNAPSLIIKHQDYSHFNACRDTLIQLGYHPVKVFCATPTFLYCRNERIDQSNTAHPSWVDSWVSFTSSFAAKLY